MFAARAILDRATRNVHAKSPYLKFFNGSRAFIATWFNVTFFGASTKPYPVCMYTTGQPWCFTWVMICRCLLMNVRFFVDSIILCVNIIHVHNTIGQCPTFHASIVTYHQWRFQHSKGGYFRAILMWGQWFEMYVMSSFNVVNLNDLWMEQLPQSIWHVKATSVLKLSQ